MNWGLALIGNLKNGRGNKDMHTVKNSIIFAPVKAEALGEALALDFDLSGFLDEMSAIF